MEKSSEEKADFIIATIDHLMRGLISPNDRNGDPKPEDVRKQDLQLAIFIDTLFFDEDADGNVTVNEKALSDLLLWFRGINMDDPDAPAYRVVNVFLADAYEKHQDLKSGNTPRPARRTPWTLSLSGRLCSSPPA